MKKTASILFAGSCLAIGMIAVAEPDWASHNTITRSPTELTVTCSGRGPAEDLARKDALRVCGASAASFLQTSVEFKTLTIQTETDSALHQETRETLTVSGLECKPLRDQIEKAVGTTVVWLQCGYDLTRVKVEPAQNNPPPPATLLSDQGASITTGNVQSSQRTLLISSIPACDSILIVGLAVRIVRCRTNPMRIQIGKGEQELIIRSADHAPKTIKLDAGTDSIKVVLDPM